MFLVILKARQPVSQGSKGTKSQMEGCSNWQRSFRKSSKQDAVSQTVIAFVQGNLKNEFLNIQKLNNYSFHFKTKPCPGEDLLNRIYI